MENIRRDQLHRDGAIETTSCVGRLFFTPRKEFARHLNAVHFSDLLRLRLGDSLSDPAAKKFTRLLRAVCVDSAAGMMLFRRAGGEIASKAADGDGRGGKQRRARVKQLIAPLIQPAAAC